MVRAGQTFQRHLVIFVKAPELGRVKTRLARDIGHVAATGWYRSNGARLIRRLSGDPRWHTSLAVTPDYAATGFHPPSWPRNVVCFAQGGGDLGARMGRVFVNFPPGPVVIIGSDIPDIACRHIVHAFEALGRSEAAIGPSADGGYWLIGLKRARRKPPPLAPIRWSTHHALADTLDCLEGYSVSMLKTLRDIDTGADLAAYTAAVEERASGSVV